MRVNSIFAAVAAVIGMLLVAPIAVLALVLLAVASLTRAVGERFGGASKAVPWQHFVEFEPTIGWRLKPNLDTFGMADDLFHITTGPDGWRGDVSVAEADIVVFGDSYAFGHGADDNKMFSAFAGDVRVKPIGSDGYDMVQGLLWMERYAQELKGKVVVWFVYYGNDLWENLLPAMGHYRKPYLRNAGGDGWQVVTDHVSPDPWPFPSSRSYHEPLAEICSDTPLSRLVESSCDDLIGRAHSLCQSAGARLVIIGVPDRIQLTPRGRRKLATLAPHDAFRDPLLPDQMLRDTCDGYGLAFVPLSEHLDASDYLLQDIHWTVTGHRKVGELLRALAVEAQI